MVFGCKYYTAEFVDVCEADLDVWGGAGNRHLFSRGPRVPQVHPIQFSWRHQQSSQPQQRQAGRGLAGRLETLLLQH